VTRNNLSSETKSTFVRINPSGITANLVLFGTSMINIGVEQDLQLDPGKHSLDGDEKPFNASVSFVSPAVESESMFSRLGLELRISLSNLSDVDFFSFVSISE
jgi:hypothetical protein